MTTPNLHLSALDAAREANAKLLALTQDARARRDDVGLTMRLSTACQVAFTEALAREIDAGGGKIDHRNLCRSAIILSAELLLTSLANAVGERPSERVVNEAVDALRLIALSAGDSVMVTGAVAMPRGHA